MLPDTDYSPARTPQTPEIPGISEPCCLDLCLPGFRQLVAPHWEAPAVPEVTVDKYGNAMIPEHEVRTARKVTRVGFPGKSGLGKQGGKVKLRARAFPLDAGHNSTARIHRHDVAAVPTHAAGSQWLALCGLCVASSGDGLLTRHPLGLAAGLNFWPRGPDLFYTKNRSNVRPGDSSARRERQQLTWTMRAGKAA